MAEKTVEETRSKQRAIIEAARGIFARQGYETTTIAEIAAAARVAVGTVYLYFRNKREIYTSVSLYWVEEITSALQNPALLSLPIEQVPRAMIETSFRICRQNNKFMPLFQVDIQSQEELKKHQVAEQSIARAIDAYLRAAIEQGQLSPFDTEMYAKLLFGLVHSALYSCFCIEAGENEERYREHTIEMVERLFFGPPLSGGKSRA